MANRVSVAACLTLGAAFLIGAGCSSIPDSRLVRPDKDHDGGIAGEDGVGGSAGLSAGKGGTAGITGSGGTGTGTGGKGAGGKAGASGSTSTGGTGTGGTAGAGGGGGGAGADGGIVGIPCGRNTCPDIVVGRTTYTACCAGAKGDRCGIDASEKGGPSCIEPRQAGLPDPNFCDNMASPDSSAPDLIGCCRPDSKCGVFYRIQGGPNFGCVNPLDLGLSAGADCTPAVCKAAGTACQNSSDCCSGPAGDPVCATFASSGGAVCSDYCVTNRDCASGCCVELASGRGACAPDASSCNAACRDLNETCDIDEDCCAGNVCAPDVDMGPRICRPKCTSDATCSPEFCVKDDAGRGACTANRSGLCTDTCLFAKNGTCEDGGPFSDYHTCALGTDCTDCKTGRTGGIALCSDSCSTAKNGKCEDGGTGAASASCGLGTDCTDCKARLGVCSNDCIYSYDGECDDGGPGNVTYGCAAGTDCADCGLRIGARGQGACDGTTGTTCQPHEGLRQGIIEDGSCDCADCAWDAVDCKPNPADKCNGVALGACCAHNNPCKLENDGWCSCGGWCEWEIPQDCGEVFPLPYCDGSISAGCDYSMPNANLKGNNLCDCKGACSWEGAECASLKLLCTDTCRDANDGFCDDEGICDYGTDCADCGARRPTP
jgi:hypothetical protein